MITIKTEKESKKGGASLIISKGTPYTTILLGAEMLIECLIKEHTPNNDIDWVLDDIKRIYLRDNRGKKMNKEEITKLCKETFMENVMTNLDSALIFTYVQTLEQEYTNLKQELRQRNEVIKEANEFLKEFHNYKNRFKWCEQDYVETINKLEEILTKFKGDNNE